MPAAYQFMSVTLETSQRLKSPLKADAFKNILRAPRAERGEGVCGGTCASRGSPLTLPTLTHHLSPLASDPLPSLHPALILSLHHALNQSVNRPSSAW